jgi:hypothetical protein
MKKTGRFRFVAGFVCGAVIFGGTAAFAAGIAANPAGYEVYINGQRVDGVYNIGGSTVLEGREFAERGGFAVTWDGSRALFDTRLPYGAVVPSPDASPGSAETPKPSAGGYGYAFNPLKTGAVVKTAPVESSKGSVGGDYKITQGCEDKPWKTSDGTVWPNVALPAWQSEWNGYPRLSFPDQPPIRFTGGVNGAPYDTLMVFNPYEVERMVRTIYKYAKNNPYLWKNDDPSANIPNFTVKIEIADDMGYNTFYPWRDWEVEKLVKSTYPEKVFRIYAYDTYNNGKFLDTEYFIK